MALNLHFGNHPFSVMEQAPFVFHLTGSRFFETESGNSDWDFFVEYQPELSVWLEANGFLMESYSDYQSTDISEVWKHASNKVHIQVISNAGLKVAVQKTLRNSRYGQWMYRLPKEDRKVLWNLAFHLYQTGKEQALSAA